MAKEWTIFVRCAACKRVIGASAALHPTPHKKPSGEQCPGGQRQHCKGRERNCWAPFTCTCSCKTCRPHTQVPKPVDTDASPKRKYFRRSEPVKPRAKHVIMCQGWCGKPKTTPCAACESIEKAEQERQRPIKEPLGRARRAGLPATLTIEQWEAAVAHFDNACAYCGEPWVLIEHAVSIRKGGGTTADNCVPACRRCNWLKGGTSLADLLRHKHYPALAVAKAPIDHDRVRAALRWLAARKPLELHKSKLKY